MITTGCKRTLHACINYKCSCVDDASMLLDQARPPRTLEQPINKEYSNILQVKDTSLRRQSTAGKQTTPSWGGSERPSPNKQEQAVCCKSDSTTCSSRQQTRQITLTAEVVLAPLQPTSNFDIQNHHITDYTQYRPSE